GPPYNSARHARRNAMSDSTQPSPQTPPSGPTVQGPADGDGQRVQELFEAWLLARDQGSNVSVADLCRDCPHLGARLAEEIALYLRFEPTAPARPGHPDLPVQEFAGLRFQPLRYHAEG